MSTFDELNEEWVSGLCERAQTDQYLRTALMVISEMNDALLSNRPMAKNYQPMLDQMMTAFGVTQVQEIGWHAKPKS